MKKNINFKIILFLIVALIAGIFFWALIQGNLTGSRAAQAMVSSIFTPESGDIFLGKENSIDLILQTDGKTGISGVDLQLESNNLSILQISKPVAVPEDSETNFTELVTEIAEDALSGRLASVLVAGDEKLPKMVKMNILVQGKTEGKCSIKINSDNAQIVGNVDGSVYGLSGAAQADFNCKAQVQKGPIVDTFFQPVSSIAQGAEKWMRTFVMQTRETSQAISGFDVKMRFNPKLLELVEVSEPFDTRPAITPTPSEVVPTVLPSGFCNVDSDCPVPVCDVNTGFCPEVKCIDNKCVVNSGGISCKSYADCPQICDDPKQTICISNQCINGKCQFPKTVMTAIDKSLQTIKFNKLRKEIDAQSGLAYLTYVVIDSDANLPTRPALNLTFKCRTKGSGTISVLQSQIVGNIEGDAYQVENNFSTYKCAGEGLEPTITPFEEDRIKVNLKLKFAGIQSKPKDQYNSLNVKCSLGDGGLTSNVERSAIFKADDNGIWSGTLSYNVSPGNNYKILCKGPKHLQKKICVGTPDESWPGTYSCDKGSISLVEGENNYDLSKIRMLVGDLPDRSKKGKQDGVVNGYDIAFVRNSFDKSDADSLSVGDLNLDGVINTIDHALIIATLERKADEY